MCVDANAAARNAAKQRWMEKDAKYKSESLKFFNREAQAVRGANLAATGFSRAISDDYTRARYAQGQAFKALEQGYSAYFGSKDTVDEGNRSRTAGRKNLVKLLQARGKLEAGIENEFGAVGIDDKLVEDQKHQEEAIVEVMNGCICCTIRGDLQKTLHQKAFYGFFFK